MHFHWLKRREFITLMGGAAATWPLAARAQERLRRIGVLIATAEDEDGKARLAALTGGLREYGWVEGNNIHVEARFAAGDPNRLQASAAELVQSAPESDRC
jgi:putative ABC transport system substrate-binding protein